MKKDNYPIFLLFFLLLFSGCQDVKKGFSGKKIDQGEEFLVIKKNPLVVPPDFEKMPLPKNEIDKNPLKLKMIKIVILKSCSKLKIKISMYQTQEKVQEI